MLVHMLAKHAKHAEPLSGCNARFPLHAMPIFIFASLYAALHFRLYCFQLFFQFSFMLISLSFHLSNLTVDSAGARYQMASNKG